MDDDMRARYRVERRDYSLPPRLRPQPPPKPTVISAPVSAAKPMPLPLKPIPQPHQPVHHPRPAVPQPPAHPAHHQPHRPPHHAPAAPAQHRPHSVPQAHPAHSAPLPRKKRKLLKRFLILVSILAILGGAAAWAYPRYYHQTKGPFPKNIKPSASTPWFYPAKLPAGYAVDDSSMHLENDVLAYAATKGNLRIVFTMQPLPIPFDFKSFYQQNLKNSQTFNSPYGTAVIGQNQDRYLGSIATEKTWFILSTNSPKVSADDLRLIMNNLKQY